MGSVDVIQGVPGYLCRMPAADLALVARSKAEGNGRRAAQAGRAEAAYDALAAEALALGVAPPVPGERGKTVDGAVARLCDERWWRRQLRQAVGRALDQQARVVGAVHRYAGAYVSNEALGRRRRQGQRTRELLESLEAVNERGDVFLLSQLQERSVANPHVRRAELMARIDGFEAVARARGDVAAFYTISCPSRMHCRRAQGGEPVPHYDGTSPREAQAYLRQLWARARAKLARLGIRFYGIRVAEPNHDGTPHWHLLLFMPAEAAETVQATLAHYALEVDRDEPGAQRHRFRVEPIDWERGSAVGYVAKYVSKNVDGYRLDTDTYGTDAYQAAERIEAWARTWGIRQFQQIGGPPVSVWRELRRASEAPAGILDQARAAADAGAWDAFVQLMRGPEAERKAQPIELAKEWSDELGRYGEPRGFETFGVQAESVTLVTRVHEWTIGERGWATDVDTTPAPSPAPIPPPGGDRRPGAGGLAPLESCQ